MGDALFDLIGADYAEASRWQIFPLDRSAIEICEELDERWVTWPEDGLSLTFERHILRRVITGLLLQVRETERMLPYRDGLPLGLDRAMSRAEIEERLGPPLRMGGNNSDGPLGYIPPWIAYAVHPGLQIQISVGGNAEAPRGIDQITIGRPMGLQ